MNPAEKLSESPAELADNDGESERFTGDDIARMLRERGWMGEAEEREPGALAAWLDRAAQLLGPQAADEAQLANLIGLIFHYDALDILHREESHLVMARVGAREVIRELGRELLTGGEVDSDRLKQLVNAVRERTGRGGRALFHPLRLALAGKAGGGEMDRVILLLDGAAKLPFAVPTKSTRERMLEFCTALD